MALPTSASALAELQAYSKTRQSPTDILNSAMAQYGIPEIRTGVSDLRRTLADTQSSLRGVESSVTGRTSGSMVTEAQRGALVNKEQQPIAQRLQDVSSSLGTQTADLQSAQELASVLASTNVQAGDTRYNSLKDVYSATTAAEAERQRQKELAAAAKREMDQFNRQQALEERKLRASQASSGGFGDIGSLLASLLAGGGGGGGGKNTTAPIAKMIQRPGGGFNFTDPAGNSTTAAHYAAIKGIPFRDLLSSMAKSGDKGAKSALGFIGNDFGYNPNKVTQQWQADLYNSLVGGYKGLKAGIYKAPAPRKAAPSKMTVGSLRY